MKTPITNGLITRIIFYDKTYAYITKFIPLYTVLNIYSPIVVHFELVTELATNRRELSSLKLYEYVIAIFEIILQISHNENREKIK